MPKIENTNVENLGQTILRSGYPMLATPLTHDEFLAESEKITTAISFEDFSSPHIKRAISLAQAKGGGHDQFLTGILVNFDLTISNKAWVEAERYTFLNFVSSMSTMHRIATFDIKSHCNQYVWSETIHKLTVAQEKYKKAQGVEEKQELYLELLYNLPSGFEITAGMTTNYRGLKNIYGQRRTHRLPDWQMFCDWIETLPLAYELITGKPRPHKDGEKNEEEKIGENGGTAS